jgi:hypothetical protein
LDEGKFKEYPSDNTAFPSWITAGTGLFSGDEKGYVQYDFRGTDGRDYGPATFYFENPTSGTNTCKVVASTALFEAKCDISQGNYANARYVLCTPHTGVRNCG